MYNVGLPITLQEFLATMTIGEERSSSRADRMTAETSAFVGGPGVILGASVSRSSGDISTGAAVSGDMNQQDSDGKSSQVENVVSETPAGGPELSQTANSGDQASDVQDLGTSPYFSSPPSVSSPPSHI